MGASESLIVDGTIESPRQPQNGTRFDQAVITGNFANVKAALQQPNVDINKQYQLGNTALYYACTRGYDSIAEYLLQNGASMRIATNSGLLPIHATAWMGHVHVMRILLKYHADVNINSKKMMCPLFLALSNRHIDCAELLLENGADLKHMSRLDDLLVKAPWHGDEKVVQFLIRHKIDVTAQVGKKGNHMIHLAAWNGHYKIVSLLLDQGEKVSCKGHAGFTALHNATLNNHLQTVDFLLDAGADISSQSDSFLQQPLHLATSKGHSDIVIALLNHGADISARDKNGLTPLHYAASKENADIIKILINFGADRFAKTLKGTLPASLAKTKEIKNLINAMVTTPCVNSPTASSVTMPSAPPIEFLPMDELPSERGRHNQTSKEQLEALITSKKTELCALQSQCKSLQAEIDEISKEIQSLQVENDKTWNLECPLCFEIPKPPMKVFQCEEGHMFCEGCASYGITHCPECRVRLGDKFIRNRRLEEIIKETY